jgi:hypothetical protein
MRRHARLAAAALAVAVALLPATEASARKRKGKKSDAPHVVSIDLSSLPVDPGAALTLSLPDDLWRAHLPRMLKYPRDNQLHDSAGKRIASRWLQATPDDARAFHAQVFFVVEPVANGSVRDWARRIANECHVIFPFEDSRFDGPWIVNEKTFKVAGKKRIKGYQLENSGGRVGEDYRSVWQLALLPMADGFNAMLGVKRRAPTTWAPGKGGQPDPGSVGIGGSSGPPTSGEGTGSLPDSGGAGDGTLGDGVGEGGDMGNVNTEPDGDQVRASSELFRALLEGVHVTVPKKLQKGRRTFHLRDEWDSAKGLTSRYVSLNVPAAWTSTPTTALRGDRIEWTEHDRDGAVTAIARIELIGSNPSPPILSYAKLRFADWGVQDVTLDDVETADGKSTAALCTTPVASSFGLRSGDDESWVREVGYVMAESTFYEVVIVRPADAASRVGELRAMLESFEIVFTY